MNNMPKRDDFPEFESLYRISESVMGFLPNSMLSMSTSPSLLLSFSMLSKVILKEETKISLLTKIKMGGNFALSLMRREREKDCLGRELRYLIAYVTSNASGCLYCKEHTSDSARRVGAAEEKINDAFNFKLSKLFSEREKSALAIAMSAGMTPNATTKEHFIELEKHFTQKEIVEIVSVISLFGFLNRWNSTLHTPLENKFQNGLKSAFKDE